ncbi:DUF3467 domain-containing protein [Candidatus Woesearchaeota archaeon]|nr:DUF3467 domain-containing protein [Candidatus Woesearchaeota archaeon]
MAEGKKINLGINDGQEFFAHEVSLNFNPTQFIFDFKCVTPRVDPRSKDTPYLSIKHNIVMVDAHHAKKIHELLGKVINDYEKKLGKIEMPKALKKAQKDSKKSKDDKTTKEAAPNYLG